MTQKTYDILAQRGYIALAIASAFVIVGALIG